MIKHIATSGKTRQEHDLLGYKEIPCEYLFGIQTLRAVENFDMTGTTLSHYPNFVKSLAIVKEAAAKANCDLGIMPVEIKDAIVKACEEIKNGEHHEQFVVDMIQGGAGTSTNMNANEVIANRALEILGHQRGEYQYCHPNNHVNMAQSTNDAYPTSARMAVVLSTPALVDVLKNLVAAFRAKSEEFKEVIKMGRTQMQDAVPMTLGQEFGAFATTLAEEILRIEENSKLFLETNMGATAIGTGINSDPDYTPICTEYMCKITGLPFVYATDMVEATNDTGAFIMFHAALKRLAVKLSKISNDLRLMSSGPRCGFAEINLPPMQPGSTIMPGKVNPVIPEVVSQVAYKVCGNDTTVTMGVEAAQLQLNPMEPTVIYCVFQSMEMLINAMETFRIRCVEGITANVDRCRDMVYNSIGLVTALNPYLGYEMSTEIAKTALESGRSVYDLVIEKGCMTKAELDEVLKPEYMVKPRKFPKQK